MHLKNVFWKRVLVAAVCLLLTAGLLQAQRLTGRIIGNVTNEQGAPLPGVTVEISSPSLLGGPRSQVTTDEGFY